MKDAIGQDLAVGDVVTYMDVTGDPGVRLARVIKFTPKFVEMRKLSVSATRAGYDAVPWGVRKKPTYVTLVTDQMRHLEDGEIFSHFDRLRKGL